MRQCKVKLQYSSLGTANKCNRDYVSIMRMKKSSTTCHTHTHRYNDFHTLKLCLSSRRQWWFLVSFKACFSHRHRFLYLVTMFHFLFALRAYLILNAILIYKFSGKMRIICGCLCVWQFYDHLWKMWLYLSPQSDANLIDIISSLDCWFRFFYVLVFVSSFCWNDNESIGKYQKVEKINHGPWNKSTPPLIVVNVTF